VFISGSDAAEVAAGVELDGEVAAADEDCAGLDDGEDASVGEVGVADDCAVEGEAAGDCVVDAGAAGAAAAGVCVLEVCAEQVSTPHTAIPQPSSTINRATIPTGKRLAARIFIRLSTAPLNAEPACSDYTSVNVHEVYSSAGTASIDPATGWWGSFGFRTSIRIEGTVDDLTHGSAYITVPAVEI
jgi:hypothetical protein